MSTHVVTSGPLDGESLFEAIHQYPWNEDQEFQAGLQAIIGSNADAQQIERLTLRARCFYYARKHNITVDFPMYQAWHNERSVTSNTAIDHPVVSQMRPTEATVQAVANATEEPPPYPLTFNQIVELISTGAPIPGIKDIPNTVLEGQSTAANKSERKKPWETVEPAGRNSKG